MTQAAIEYQKLELQQHDHVLVVTLNNPPMNVLDMQVGLELDRLITEVADDTSVRVILFQSAVPNLFMAGADVSMLAQLSDDSVAHEFKKFATIFDRLEALPQPTVCAINGICLGGGFELALACDFRLMAEGTGEVGLPEVRLGLLPGGGGTQRLPRIVGHAVATEMLLKGMRYQPTKALELNLVHKVFPADEFDNQVLKFASSLAAQAPLAVQSIKRLIRASYNSPGQTGLELERELFLKVARTADSKEGIDAFFSGRKPTFHGE